jgi:hypothetical protein
MVRQWLAPAAAGTWPEGAIGQPIGAIAARTSGT